MARVTLKMIAQEAGVSVATVSMALRGQGQISKERAKEIKTLAERLGYTPDPMLASLASRRFRSGEQAQGLPLALLEFPAYKGSESQKQYRDTLIEVSKKLGYAPQVYSPKEMSRYQELTRILFHRGTQAIIISGQPDLSLFKEQKKWNHFVIAQCGRYRAALPVPTIRPSIFQAIKLCFDQVYARGYRRIGFALGHHDTVLEDDYARLGTALGLLDQCISPENRVPPYFEPFGHPEQMVEWAKRHQPDAYIGFTPHTYHTLKEAGIHCPRDAGFAALHLAEDNREIDNLTIAGLDQSLDEVARQSVLLVDQMVRHNDRGIMESPRQVLISSKWIEGDTLPERIEN